MTSSPEARAETDATHVPSLHDLDDKGENEDRKELSGSSAGSSSSSGTPDRILVPLISSLAVAANCTSSSQPGDASTSLRKVRDTSEMTRSQRGDETTGRDGSVLNGHFRGESSMSFTPWQGLRRRIPARKKDPLFLKEHHARVKSEKTRTISSLTAQLKTHVHKKLRIPNIEELLTKRLAVERHIAGSLVDSVTDEDIKVRHLREILKRNEDVHHASLRIARRKTKEQERLAHEEKLLRRRALGIAGRKPLPDHLEAEEEDFVDEVFNKQGNIASITGAGVAARDIQKLRPGQWLNDEVINFYMKMIELRSTEALQKRAESRKAKIRLSANTYEEDGADGASADEARKRDIALVSAAKKKWNGIWNVHVFNTFFYEKLSKTGYAGVRQWTRRVDLFTKDRVLVPVNLGQSHWVCAVINMRDCRFEYYDSMGMENARVFDVLAMYVAEEYKDKKKESFGPLDLSGWRRYTSRQSPQQANGYDCGVFATMTIEQLSRRHPLDGQLDDDINAEVVVKHSRVLADAGRGTALDREDSDSLEEDEEWNFSQRNIPYIRRRMVYEIAKTALLDR